MAFCPPEYRACIGAQAFIAPASFFRFHHNRVFELQALLALDHGIRNQRRFAHHVRRHPPSPNFRLLPAGKTSFGEHPLGEAGPILQRPPENMARLRIRLRPTSYQRVETRKLAGHNCFHQEKNARGQLARRTTYLPLFQAACSVLKRLPRFLAGRLRPCSRTGVQVHPASREHNYSSDKHPELDRLVVDHQTGHCDEW